MGAFAALALSLSLACCSKEELWVQSVAVRSSSLASRYVGTPDPRRECPDLGQKLVTRWKIPKSCRLEDGYFLVLAMRFGSREERVLLHPLRHHSGYYTYKLLNDEYFEREGIQSFKAEIVLEDRMIYEWRHQVWVDLMEIPISDEPNWEGRDAAPSELPFEGLSF